MSGHSFKIVMHAKWLFGFLLFVSGMLRAELPAGAAFVLGRLALRLVVRVCDGGVERLLLGIAVFGAIVGTIAGIVVGPLVGPLAGPIIVTVVGVVA